MGILAMMVTVDSRDSAQGELDALVTRTLPDAPYGLQILHPDPKATVEYVPNLIAINS